MNKRNRLIQQICMTELKYKTLDEKKEQCKEIDTELRKGLLCYPMKNCFNYK